MIGFEPIYDERAEVLILGSFPSVKSREVGFYYGNPQNRFWTMLARVFGDSPKTVEEKCAFLKSKRIALYDAVAECDIKSSADDELRASANKTPARINELTARMPHLKKILCNGKLAYDITMKEGVPLPVVCMQSTSPRNAHYRYEEWEDELKFLLKV